MEDIRAGLYVRVVPAPGRIAVAVGRACGTAGVCLLALVLGIAGASAQSASGTGFTHEDVAIRDNLIAAQETLLNVYRCRFGIDVQEVSGGCTNGLPSQGFSQPAEFEGTPTLRDIRVRDQLIQLQESLLNTYRCRFEFEIDTHITPEGCPGQAGSEPFLTLDLDPMVRPEDFAGDPPPGLITPTGVSVAVMGLIENAFVVMTPCGNISTVRTGLPLQGVQVVLDPGHGGSYDVGAIGPNGLAEPELNLTLAHAVLSELSSRGISAATTRTGQYGSPLLVRAAFADALGADALISIHHNAPTFPTGSQPGTEVYVQSASPRQARAESARLGGLLYQEITEALSGFDNVAWSRLSDAGVMRVLLSSGGDAYGLIRRPKTPSVLVEYGYLSNPSEAALFATDDYIRVAAKATANAIEAYLNTDRSGTPAAQRSRVFNPARAPTSCNEVALE